MQRQTHKFLRITDAKNQPMHKAQRDTAKLSELGPPALRGHLFCLLKRTECAKPGAPGEGIPRGWNSMGKAQKDENKNVPDIAQG